MMKPKPLRLDDDAPWKKRYRAPAIAWAQLARSNNLRGLVTSTETGEYQLYAWNVRSGELRQLTHRPEGTMFGIISPNGQYVYYLQDDGGNEIGHFVRLSWEGGEAEDITPAMAPYSAFGLNISRSGNMIGSILSDNSGFHAILLPVRHSDAIGASRELHRSTKMIFGPSLSYGGEIGVITSTERTTFQHNGLVAFETASGKRIGELWEEGSSLMAFGFSPLPGDFRLLATSTLTGYNRPFIWNPVSGERTELSLPDLSGDIWPMEWSTGGKRILLRQSQLAIQRLAVYDTTTGRVTRLNHPDGFYGMGIPFASAAAFSDSELLVMWQDSTHPPQLVALDSRTGKRIHTVLPAGDVPPGHPWKQVTFKSSDGETIQGWLALPQGNGPFPTILHVHGGPETQTVEYFMPSSQAWVDHGFAWLAINYRGSIGFGRAFREKIWGNLGHWELEDMVAARNWLVKQGIADARQILLHGWSYGGYLTLLALGKCPDIWAGGMAGTATVDWAMEYEDLSAAMRGYSVASLGGTPQEKSEQYAAASPITYMENVKAPVLIIQGRNDTRTPARPVEVYEARMRALGKAIEVRWYDGGHLGGGVEEAIQQQEIMLRFAYSVLDHQ
jgi:dipeptidyl aminopeptidase/acylaminoacyl peptidase